VITGDLLDAFARSYYPPHWVIEGLQNSADDSIRAAVSSVLASITPTDLAELDHDARATADVLFRAQDPEARARLLIASRRAARAVHCARVAELIGGGQSPGAPYGHPALRGIDVDEEGLVPLAAFELDGDALCAGGYSFFMLPAVPGSNANYWLLQQIQRNDLIESFKIRLDPLLHGPSDQLAGHGYKMLVYGRPLDWERIRELRTTDHGRWVPGKLSCKALATDYAWVPHAEEVDFVCEELPLVADAQDRGARYLHMVYDKTRHEIKHLDGALRIYTQPELVGRSSRHVRNAGKAGVRVKAFRTDHPIRPDGIGDLIQAFFVWNYDVARYFGASVPADF
jgi:hypothetical protein